MYFIVHYFLTPPRPGMPGNTTKSAQTIVEGDWHPIEFTVTFNIVIDVTVLELPLTLWQSRRQTAHLMNMVCRGDGAQTPTE